MIRAFWLAGLCAAAQPLPPATIVLTPELCETNFVNGSRVTSTRGFFRQDAFAVGKEFCDTAVKALEPVFASVTRSSRRGGSTPLEIVPAFVNASASKPRGSPPAAAKRELIVLFEWTVRDANGKALWIETVQGAAELRIGYGFANPNPKFTKAAVADLLRRSAQRMAAAPALLR